MRLAMRPCRRPFDLADRLILPILLPALVFTAVPVATATAAALPPALARILDSPGHPAMRADGTVAVWVFFEEATPLPAALDRAAAALTPRAMARRRRTLGPGERLVDRHDLPLPAARLEAAAATGARLRRTSRWLRAASYDATPQQVRALAALPAVRRVAPVGMTLRIPPPPAATAPAAAPRDGAGSAAWTLDYGASLGNLELINVPPVHELGYTGAGVLIAFLDTGFRVTHEALAHVPVVDAYDFAGDDGNVDTEPGDPDGTRDHGTQVMSTVLAYAPGALVGVAPGASVLLARAEMIGTSDPIEEDWWVAALEWAEAQGADLVSSSLGYWNFHDPADLDGDTAASTVAADMAAARGLLVVNGVGNLGALTNQIAAPADGDSVLAVGGTEPSGLAAIWSSRGPTADGRIKPDVTAQGVSVPVVDPDVDTAYTTNSGTSFSGPQVAGVVALMLERAPFLTPEQVLTALRATAGRHDAPDNAYGWGLVDALAALRYWGPRCEHTPLADTENDVGPYTVSAVVTAPFGLAGAPLVRFRVDGVAWYDLPMTPRGGDVYTADLPGLPHGSVVEYYLEAVDVQGQVNRFPWNAPDASHAFVVDVDTEAPSLAHLPLGDQALGAWPPAVTATVTDNLGVAEVTVTCRVNNTPVGGPRALMALPDDRYARPFPLAAADLHDGDVVSYTLSATDAALQPNTAQAGPFIFTVVAGAGDVLILEDASGEAALVAGWLGGAGYGTTVRSAAAATATDLEGRQAAVLLCGANGDPVASATLRALVEGWVADGGRLLVSGGEIGWVSLVVPAYPSFAANVLHAGHYYGDSTEPLDAVAGQAGHPLLTHPHPVALPLTFGTTGETVADAVAPTADATLVLENTAIGGVGGALVHDDDPSTPGVQVVYLPFALNAVADQGAAADLVVNALALLLENGAPSHAGEAAPGAAPVHLARIGPNPFNARLLVGLEVLRAGPVRLDVFDLRGRRLRGLLDPGVVLPPGPRQVVWDGRDAHGRELASGVYLVRLRAGASLQRAKVVLVR